MGLIGKGSGVSKSVIKEVSFAEAKELIAENMTRPQMGRSLGYIYNPVTGLPYQFTLTDKNVVIVDTLQKFKDAITSAVDNDAIVIQEGVDFDLTAEQYRFDVNKKVFILGQNPKNRNVIDYGNMRSSFRFESDEIGFSNIYTKGTHTGITIPNGEEKQLSIHLIDVKNCFISNCEFSGFSFMALRVERSKNLHVLDSYFHQCQFKGLGYGIDLENEGSTVLAYRNIFKEVRHHITGTGHSGQEFDFFCNFCGTSVFYPSENSTVHVVDMHEIEGMSGCRVSVWGNIFEGNPLNYPKELVGIRGVPEQFAEVMYNTVMQSNESLFVAQKIGEDIIPHSQHQNIYEHNNEFLGEKFNFLGDNDHVYSFGENGVHLNNLKTGEKKLIIHGCKADHVVAGKYHSGNEKIIVFEKGYVFMLDPYSGDDVIRKDITIPLEKKKVLSGKFDSTGFDSLIIVDKTNNYYSISINSDYTIVQNRITALDGIDYKFFLKGNFKSADVEDLLIVKTNDDYDVHENNGGLFDVIDNFGNFTGYKHLLEVDLANENTDDIIGQLDDNRLSIFRNQFGNIRTGDPSVRTTSINTIKHLFKKKIGGVDRAFILNDGGELELINSTGSFTSISFTKIAYFGNCDFILDSSYEKTDTTNGFPEIKNGNYYKVENALITIDEDGEDKLWKVKDFNGDQSDVLINDFNDFVELNSKLENLGRYTNDTLYQESKGLEKSGIDILKSDGSINIELTGGNIWKHNGVNRDKDLIYYAQNNPVTAKKFTWDGTELTASNEWDFVNSDDGTGLVTVNTNTDNYLAPWLFIIENNGLLEFAQLLSEKVYNNQNAAQRQETATPNEFPSFTNSWKLVGKMMARVSENNLNRDRVYRMNSLRSENKLVAVGATSEVLIYRDTVVDKYSRPDINTVPEGFRVYTIRNQLTYVKSGAIWRIEDYLTSVSTKSFLNGMALGANLADLEPDQRVYVREEGKEYRWDATIGAWVDSHRTLRGIPLNSINELKEVLAQDFELRRVGAVEYKFVLGKTAINDDIADNAGTGAWVKILNVDLVGLRKEPVADIVTLTALTPEDDELRLVKEDNLRRVFKLGVAPVLSTDIADNSNTGSWVLTKEIETPTNVLSIISEHRPVNLVDVNNLTPVNTGHNLNELDYVDFNFKDNVGGVNRPWNLVRIDAKQFVLEGSAYLWNYDLAFVRADIVNAQTGEITLTISTRDVLYIGSIGYKKEQVGSGGGLASIPSTARYQNNKAYNEGDFVIESDPNTGLAVKWYADADFTSVDEVFEANGFTQGSDGLPLGVTTDITGQNNQYKSFQGAQIFDANVTLRDQAKVISIFRSPFATAGLYGIDGDKARYAISEIDGKIYQAKVTTTIADDPSINIDEWKVLDLPTHGFDYAMPANNQSLSINVLNILEVGKTYKLPPAQRGKRIFTFVNNGTTGNITINRDDDSSFAIITEKSGRTLFYSNGIDWFRISDASTSVSGGATLKNYYDIITLGDQNTGFTQDTEFGWDGIDACVVAGGGMTSRIPIEDDTATRVIEWIVRKTTTPQNFVVEARDNPSSNGTFKFLNTNTGVVTTSVSNNAAIASTITHEVFDLGSYWKFTCTVTGKAGNEGGADFIFTFVAGDGYVQGGAFVGTTENIYIGSVKYEKLGQPKQQWVVGDNYTGEFDTDGKEIFMHLLENTQANRAIGTGGINFTDGSAFFVENLIDASGYIEQANESQILVNTTDGANKFLINRANASHVAVDIAGYVPVSYKIFVKYTKQ